jgi:hypothetical protein
MLVGSVGLCKSEMKGVPRSETVKNGLEFISLGANEVHARSCRLGPIYGLSRGLTATSCLDTRTWKSSMLYKKD